MKILRKTKIVATIGPQSSSSEMIEKLVRAGMNVARLNFSYGEHEEHAKVIRAIRQVSTRLGIPVAILQDLPGPKLRTGRLRKKAVELRGGADFSLVGNEVPGDEHRVSVSMPTILGDVKSGDTIFLEDGAIELKVTSATENEVKCKVVVGGLLGANKGINVPGTKLKVSSITEEDLEHLSFGLEQGVDFVAISFVRAVEDVLRMKQFLKVRKARVPLIAKIEKHEAVGDIDRIIAEADGIMIARGDLGVEIPLKEVPIVQKEIINKCNRVGKPVIVATQMLESMVNAVRPTRAEVGDVANAIFDGADAVMLSAETAIGSYPVETVNIMSSIAVETEKVLPYERILLEREEKVLPETDDAISHAACHIAQHLGAACIVAYTTSGSTALRVSKNRPRAPILAITPDAGVARRLILSWGIEPYSLAEPLSVDSMFREVVKLASKTGIAARGELVVVTAGIPMGTPGSTNLVKVERVD